MVPPRLGPVGLGVAVGGTGVGFGKNVGVGFGVGVAFGAQEARKALALAKDIPSKVAFRRNSRRVIRPFRNRSSSSGMYACTPLVGFFLRICIRVTPP